MPNILRQVPKATGFFLIAAATIWTAPAAHAITRLTYRCEVILATADMPPDKGTFVFEAPEKAGTHGGEPRSFREGDHQIDVIADASWLGLSWSKGGVKIAQGLFAMGPMDRAMARAAILYRPDDSGDLVSVDCGEGALIHLSQKLENPFAPEE